nr:MAG TPA: N-terminal domain of cytochrome oxidase-cbb3, FixP [Caudoviricetes sp.]
MRQHNNSPPTLFFLIFYCLLVCLTCLTSIYYIFFQNVNVNLKIVTIL